MNNHPVAEFASVGDVGASLAGVSSMRVLPGPGGCRDGLITQCASFPALVGERLGCTTHVG
ncbi:hypothetical protein [uncultured Cohaesibacter sp.]|uniref:hypothetical protein n=1 Tax=uncultured Cohaesibacter sp. TaxID=1002546 RepID=UPI00292CBEB2|nr:hypothetical protein [uncultured Cohaesibacter sp.]